MIWRQSLLVPVLWTAGLGDQMNVVNGGVRCSNLRCRRQMKLIQCKLWTYIKFWSNLFWENNIFYHFPWKYLINFHGSMLTILSLTCMQNFEKIKNRWWRALMSAEDWVWGLESLNPLNPGLKKISFSTENFVETMLHLFLQTEEKLKTGENCKQTE